jgi:hypothetical protein
MDKRQDSGIISRVKRISIPLRNVGGGGVPTTWSIACISARKLSVWLELSEAWPS